MRHRKAGYKLGRTTAHRTAMLRNMAGQAGFVAPHATPPEMQPVPGGQPSLLTPPPMFTP